MLALSGILAVLLAVPESRIMRTDSVDIVEINHHLDDEGKVSFDQVIWWELIDGFYHVVDWRMLNGCRDKKKKFVPGHACPVYDHKRRLWVSRWRDGRAPEDWREVTAVGFRETWTLFDPELDDRQVLPQEYRRRLSP